MEIYRKQTPYGLITVCDEKYNIRSLYVDGHCQGRAKKPLFTPESWYMKEILRKVRKIKPKPKNAMVFGGGVLLIPNALQRMGIPTVSVERNREILLTANFYFGSPVCTSWVCDANQVSEYEVWKYDLLIIDAYDGFSKVPIIIKSRPDQIILENVIEGKKQYIRENRG